MDFEIDLDSECVWLDDAWFNRDDLVLKIRGMMDAGNFEIARPSQALEALTKALANARLLALRISPEMSEALNVAAQQSGRPVGAIARDAIAAWLGSVAPAAQATTGAVAVPLVSVPIEPVDNIVVDTAAEEAITTEPATAEEAAQAVELTPKRREADGAADLEKRWFDK